LFGNSFYHETTRRLVASFGTLFNDIKITRKNNAGEAVQSFKVPLSYGPRQKFLARIEGDPNLNAPALTVPRMGFELLNVQYNGERKLTSRMKSFIASAQNDNFITNFTPVPYDFEFELTIIAKYTEDGTRIVEQILPHFTPDFGLKIQLVDDTETILDIPVVLNSVTTEDLYEGSFEERRAITWTLGFTMQAYYFGPTTPTKVIKFVKVNLYDDLDIANSLPQEVLMVQPGLTANGEPTQVLSESIDYANIHFDDDWGYITRIEDYEE